MNPSRILHPIRRGFNLIELLISLAITATLLVATLVALNASFMAYQFTTEEASTQTIGRLTMHRIMSMIRTGEEFRPLPASPLISTVESDYMEFRMPDAAGTVMSLQWFQNATSIRKAESLYVVLNPDTPGEKAYLLMEGVKPQYRPATDPVNPGGRIKPFTLQYQKGRYLYRATVDLAVIPDDNMSVMIDGNNQNTIRLVASAMPRVTTFE